MLAERHWVKRAIVGFLAVWALAAGPRLPAVDVIVWDTQKNRVDAEIQSWDLPRLLEEIATATGWQVWVEPGTQHKISTKFKDRTTDKALELLLGDLSYARLPQTSGAPKLVVFRTSEARATQRVPPRDPASANKAKPILNELIVTLKPGEKIDELARKLGAKVLGRDPARNAYRLQFDDAESAQSARRTLLEDERVNSIDYNYTIAPGPQPDSVDFGAPLNLRPKVVGDAKYRIVGLIDTAVQPQASSIKDFLLPGQSVVGEAQPPDDVPTHGTSMSETILRGVSMSSQGKDGSAVRILPVDVYGNKSTTTTFEVARGIDQAISQGATIINLSLGSDGDSGYLREVIKSAQAQGVLFFAAAGNEPSKAASYPAAYSEVIAVTAGDSKGNIAPYANFGDFVDIVAPGTGPVTFQNQIWRVSGTSAATAYAAGMAAGLAEDARKSLAQIEAALRQNLAPKAK
jgi:hypothetical protein